MRERIGTIGPIAAVAGALGLCCALPILLSLGVVGAIAGWALQIWALLAIGFVLAAVGWARLVRGRRHDKTCPPPGAAAAQPADSTSDIGTDTKHRENLL